MSRKLFFLTLLFASIFANGTEYDSESTIINIKHGYQLGDLLVVEDQITANVPFLKNPQLMTAKSSGLRLVVQESHSASHNGKYTFFNKVTYQIFHRSAGMQYVLPTHNYTIGDDEVEVPGNSYWFTRIAMSELNKVLLNALGQVKPRTIKDSRTYFYLLIVLSFSSFLILLYKKMDLSFVQRMNGPFTKANKKIKFLHQTNNRDSYDEAIIILLDACNKSFDKNINALNVEDLIHAHSKYHPVKYAIKSFVTLTNSEIYSLRTYYSKDRFDDVYRLAQLLKVIERRI